MSDIFDNTVICNECKCQMQKGEVEKNGFFLRALECPKCKKRIIHPKDEHEYKDFAELKSRHFNVKLRMVGNSYAISIPREIVDFMREQEKMMSDMVSLCFEEAGKLSLEFEQHTKNMKERIDKLKYK